MAVVLIIGSLLLVNLSQLAGKRLTYTYVFVVSCIYSDRLKISDSTLRFKIDLSASVSSDLKALHVSDQWFISAFTFFSENTPDFSTFKSASESEISKILLNCTNKQCDSDPIPIYVASQRMLCTPGSYYH